MGCSSSHVADAPAGKVLERLRVHLVVPRSLPLSTGLHLPAYLTHAEAGSLAACYLHNRDALQCRGGHEASRRPCASDCPWTSSSCHVHMLPTGSPPICDMQKLASWLYATCIPLHHLHFSASLTMQRFAMKLQNTLFLACLKAFIAFVSDQA